MIDVYATESHFAEHLAAVLLALPPEARGNAIAGEKAAEHGYLLHGLIPSGPAVIRERPVLVASSGNLRSVRRHGRRFAALMEHGAGQSYAGVKAAGRHPSYAGGMRRDADLFLHPGPHPAARDRAAYPAARVEVVGSPYLDLLPARDASAGPVLAYSTHYNLGFLPETKSAFAWIRPQLIALASRYQLIGHAHPRYIEELAPWYRKQGIETVRDFADVCRRADLFIADNTSALFAFAATGRPVVVINPPTYRREVDHGLRFWEAVGGPQGDGPARIGIRVDKPEQLPEAVARALENRPTDVAARQAALDLVYAYRSGAAARAATVLLDWIASLPHHLKEAAA